MVFSFGNETKMTVDFVSNEQFLRSSIYSFNLSSRNFDSLCRGEYAFHSDDFNNRRLYTNSVIFSKTFGERTTQIWYQNINWIRYSRIVCWLHFSQPRALPVRLKNTIKLSKIVRKTQLSISNRNIKWEQKLSTHHTLTCASEKQMVHLPDPFWSRTSW